MIKKVAVHCAAFTMLATPALAQDTAQDPPAQYNCDYQPSCEVAPGIYGKMSNPVVSKFKLSIGGYVKLDYAYNSTNLGPKGAMSPVTGSIPSKGLTATATAANQDQSILSVRQSRLWFKVDGPTFLGARTSAVIESDFYGDAAQSTESPQFRVRLAYGAMDWANTQLLFGQFWDLFAPMAPSTLDFTMSAPYGAPTSPRTPQVRLTHRINLNPDNQLKIIVAVQDPSQYGNNAATPSGTYGSYVNVASNIFYINKSLGVSPAYFGMSMNSFMAGIFGLYGSEHDPANGNHHLDSYGYGAYAFVPILKSKDGLGRTMTMSFEGQAYAAGNMPFNLATSTAAVGTNPTVISPNPTSLGTFDAAGNQKPARSWGYTGQIMFYPTQNLGITGGYGTRYALNNGDYAGATNYQQQDQEVYANVTYDLNAAIRVGAEYQNLETKYGNANGVAGAKATGVDNTIRLCAFYFF